MSIMHIQRVDRAQLDSREQAIIADSESRRFKFNDDDVKQVMTGDPSSAIEVKKRPREEDDDDSDDEPIKEEAVKTDKKKKEDESRLLVVFLLFIC